MGYLDVPANRGVLLAFEKNKLIDKNRLIY